jgi:hypothetical protein
MFRTAARLAVVTLPKLSGNHQTSVGLTAKRCFVLTTPLKMASASAGKDDYKHAVSIYEFKAKDIDGNEVSMDKYKGQVVIIVNVACK